MSRAKIIAAAALLALAPVGYADDDGKPSFIKGEILSTTYDGVTDDLLTAGLGKTGLQLATPPGFVDALAPTKPELRRRAIHQNYRALVDTTTNGGYGVLYGPNIDLNGGDTLGEGKIAGEEHLAFAGDASGKKNVTLMVQVPNSFNPADPCIVTAPSSGSRGVYGAIGTAGEWGLKRGCAVAYTDKGTGNGAHDLQNDTVNLINGLRARADEAGKDSNFTARISDDDRADFNAATPNRFAFKHAHSRQNPEKDWGKNVLQSIRFAFFVLNQKFGKENDDGDEGHKRITPRNTIVIASSVSNGGGSSLAATEQDNKGLIDGVAVGEPQIQPAPDPALTIMRGATTLSGGSQALFDYTSLANLFEPCAAYANPASPALGFVNAARADNRCAALKANGLLAGTTLTDQRNEALAVLRANGWEAESDLLHASHYAFATPAIAVTYANTYGKFKVQDNLCGFSFGATDATFLPTAASAANVAKIFADGNGIPPTGGINIINNLSLGGPKLDGASVSPSTNAEDFNVDGALCLRSLATGTDDEAERVQEGIANVRPSANLKGKPAIIVHGRSDTLVPVNHSSRPYVGINKLKEGDASRLNYYEVTNAQHFDTFIGNPLLAGYDTRFVPLHHYFIQALNLMYDHLKNGTPLPPSQVVHTTPRGGTPGAAPQITLSNVPPIEQDPAQNALITFDGNVLTIPD